MIKDKAMKGLVYAVLGLLCAFLAVEISHVANTAASANTVSFSGTGKATAAPDVAVIDASIVTQAPDSKTAQDQNSTKSAAVTDFLKKQSIADADIKTTDYNIYPQYKYPSDGGQPSITGYQVTQSYEIKVRNLDNVSTVLDGLVSAGANQVTNLGLQIDNPDGVTAQARQMAIDDAKKKASDLESQLGIKLGHIVDFSESTGGVPVPIAYDVKSQADGIGGGPTVSPGQNTVTDNVTLTYQIK